jgi:site-specific DNA-methyltransferase (adenine-specific)/modification methylase
VKLGRATLYCADCREILAALPQVDALVTDPPYGAGFASGAPTKWRRRAGYLPEDWDSMPVADIEAVRNLGRIQAIWGGNYYPLPPSRGWLSWFKPDAPPTMAHFELCWTNLDQNARQFVYSISATNVERFGIHPTQKPLRLMEWTLHMVSAVGVVCDPFMGIGTTGVAAINLGHEFIGVEIDPRYFDVACERIAAAQAQGRLFA